LKEDKMKRITSIFMTFTLLALLMLPLIAYGYCNVAGRSTNCNAKYDPTFIIFPEWFKKDRWSLSTSHQITSDQTNHAFIHSMRVKIGSSIEMEGLGKSFFNYYHSLPVGVASMTGWGICNTCSYSPPARTSADATWN